VVRAVFSEILVAEYAHFPALEDMDHEAFPSDSQGVDHVFIDRFDDLLDSFLGKALING